MSLIGVLLYSRKQPLGQLITLGAPHQGALFERIGNFIQQSIVILPFAGALAKLGDIGSVGIIDLRHGSIRDEYWQLFASPSHSVLADNERDDMPLPKQVATTFWQVV